MRSITLSQLRTPKLWLPWLRAGETILLCERRTVIARIVPHESFIERSIAPTPEGEAERSS
jgi:antitoxin (DNA-binding transcriptional repressor) of toxin-antitoxin stability system